LPAKIEQPVKEARVSDDLLADTLFILDREGRLASRSYFVVLQGSNGISYLQESKN